MGQTLLPDSIQKRFTNVLQDSNYINQLNTLATSYLKINPNASRQIAAHVTELSPRLKYTRGYARALTILGNSYWYEGVYEFAQNYYLLAARQYQVIVDSIGLSQVYNNIGEVNKRLGENKKALEYLQRSIEFQTSDSLRAMTLYNIGELYVTIDQPEKATPYLNESIGIARSRNDERVIAYNYWSMARMREMQGRDREAFDYFRKAEELWIKLGETRSLIQTYQDMARALRQRDQLEEALTYLTKASTLATRIHVPDLRINTYLEYFKLDSARGNYKKAVYYLSRHNTLKDSVYDLLKAEQIARVQAIYETDLHERENQALRVEKKIKEAQLVSQNLLIIAVSFGFLVAGILVWMLIRQRKKILTANHDLKEKNEEINTQKNAIELQAAALVKLNEALQELNRSLEDRIDERSRQLVIQNQKLSEYAFFNAHKLRAPVASILGLINLIQTAEPHEQNTIIAHLKTCGDQLDSIIRNVSRELEDGMIP